MAVVIAQPCVGTKDAACVTVCPVDCIHPTPDEPGFAEAEMLYVNAPHCVCCRLCIEECPVGAIFDEAASSRPSITFRMFASSVESIEPPMVSQAIFRGPRACL